MPFVNHHVSYITNDGLTIYHELDFRIIKTKKKKKTKENKEEERKWSWKESTDCCVYLLVVAQKAVGFPGRGH